MHYLYIIYSETADKFYVGETADPVQRLKDHNSHKYKKGFTKAGEDWKVVLQVKLEKEEALFLEQFIKRMKSRKFIQKLIVDPSILKDILGKR